MVMETDGHVGPFPDVITVVVVARGVKMFVVIVVTIVVTVVVRGVVRGVGGGGDVGGAGVKNMAQTGQFSFMQSARFFGSNEPLQ